MPEKKKDKLGESASVWKSRYDIAVNNQQKYFERVSKWYDILYAVFNTSNIAPWRSKIYIPVLGSKLWDLVSKFINVRPGWEVSIREEYDDEADIRAEASDRHEGATRLQRGVAFGVLQGVPGLVGGDAQRGDRARMVDRLREP